MDFSERHVLKTYGTRPVGYVGPDASVANQETHVFYGGVGGRLVEIGQLKVFNKMAGEFGSARHLPEDEAESVDVSAFERLKLRDVQSVVEHFRSHVSERIKYGVALETCPRCPIVRKNYVRKSENMGPRRKTLFFTIKFKRKWD